MSNGTTKLNVIETEHAYRVLKDIETNPSITQRSLSEKHQISLGKTNYILNALIEKGIIKAQNFKNSNNKAAYMYVLTPEGIVTKSQLARAFIKRKREEYERLKVEIEAFAKELEPTPSDAKLEECITEVHS